MRVQTGWWGLLALAGCAAGVSQDVTVADAVPLLGPSQAPDGFWETWGDGLAELSSYHLRQPRYGEVHDGEAVLVFVTETLTDATRVKSDGGHTDEVPVMKLNEVRDFETGIYDYNLITSTFVRLNGTTSWGVPDKVSFASQDWCGHVYEQLVPRGDRVTRTSHSYFDGEADAEGPFAVAPRAVFEDALPILVRGLVGRPGHEVAVDVFDRSLSARFSHSPAQFSPATLSWSDDVTQITVPAGTIAASPVTLDREVGVDATYWVEVAAPHRIVRWTRSDGASGELVATVREPYWDEHRQQDAPHRRALGLPVRTWAGDAPAP